MSLKISIPLPSGNLISTSTRSGRRSRICCCASRMVPTTVAVNPSAAVISASASRVLVSSSTINTCGICNNPYFLFSRRAASVLPWPDCRRMEMRTVLGIISPFNLQTSSKRLRLEQIARSSSIAVVIFHCGSYGLKTQAQQ